MNQHFPGDVSDALFRPVLGGEELGAIVQRLVALYKRVRRIQAEAQRRAEPLQIIWSSDIAKQPLKSRLDCVDDAISGLEYAAWCIGEALCAVGGLALMHHVFALFEEANEPDACRAGSWLDHRWSGVCVGDQIWAA